VKTVSKINVASIYKDISRGWAAVILRFYRFQFNFITAEMRISWDVPSGSLADSAVLEWFPFRSILGTSSKVN
jgi:hypothetical protein